MRKIVSMLLFVAMAFAVAAQDLSSEHLKFMGIPIDGPLDSFVAKLKQKGLKYDSEINGTVILKGNFAGYDNCSFYVTPVKNKDIVCCVGVCLPHHDTWDMLYGEYEHLKLNLIKKYGYPVDCEESFQSEVQPEDDRMKMYYAKSDRLKFSTSFDAKTGFIMLKINHAKDEYVDRCYVSVLYLDIQNYSYQSDSVLDDL